jgi:hypothetical protein
MAVALVCQDLLVSNSLQAALAFSIDTFTADQLTISIPTGSATLDQFGGANSSRDLFLIDSTALNNSWVLSTTFSFSGSGQLGSGSVDGGSAAMFNNNGSGGDIVRLTFDADLADGNTVGTAITATWSGSKIFDPSGVSSLLLTWGTDGIGSVYPWGDPQNTTPVPEPHHYALMGGIGCLGLAVFRRFRASASKTA